MSAACSVRAGAGYIRENRTLAALAAQAVAFVFFSAVIPIEVVFAKETLGAGDTGYGLLLGSWGVGMVIGSIVFAALRRAPLPVLLFFSTIAVGAGYLGTAVAQTLAVACAASAVGGAGNGVQWVAVMSAVQELTVPRMQARVIGVLESIGVRHAGGRLRPRRPDRDRLQPAGDVPRRRRRRDRDRGDRGPAARHEMAASRRKTPPMRPPKRRRSARDYGGVDSGGGQPLRRANNRLSPNPEVRR